MKTMSERIKEAGITMTCTTVNDNPHMPDSDNMHHWKCTLRCQRSCMTIYFSQGYGIQHDPELPNVLDCLASDAGGWENARTFKEWANDYGYDTDSRKAEKIFHTVKKQTEKFKAFLGDSLYDALLWNTDRE